MMRGRGGHARQLLVCAAPCFLCGCEANNPFVQPCVAVEGTGFRVQVIFAAPFSRLLVGRRALLGAVVGLVFAALALLLAAVVLLVRGPSLPPVPEPTGAVESTQLLAEETPLRAAPALLRLRPILAVFCQAVEVQLVRDAWRGLCGGRIDDVEACGILPAVSAGVATEPVSVLQWCDRLLGTADTFHNAAEVPLPVIPLIGLLSVALVRAGAVR
mmetsp:Transcript_7077/g.16783  ORF Transcript_7077/g.16783 Transcript_7077/m.16783 type:complete len:215 (-) Transcript_7077:189-833(-)